MSCKKRFYVFFFKFGDFSWFVTLEIIILVRAISKCFQNKIKNVKAYYKQVNKHSLKMNVNLTAKLLKATLKYIKV